jgi:hypothetical protein
MTGVCCLDGLVWCGVVGSAWEHRRAGAMRSWTEAKQVADSAPATLALPSVGDKAKTAGDDEDDDVDAGGDDSDEEAGADEEGEGEEEMEDDEEEEEDA